MDSSNPTDRACECGNQTVLYTVCSVVLSFVFIYTARYIHKDRSQFSMHTHILYLQIYMLDVPHVSPLCRLHEFLPAFEEMWG